MVKIEQKDGGVVIAKKVLFAATVPHENYINLTTEKGENLFYEKMPFKMIDFPGEYDIDGVLIKGILGAGGKLSYVLTIDEKTIGLIMTPDVLDRDDVNDMDFWLFNSEKVENKIDQLELEGEKISLIAE